MEARRVWRSFSPVMDPSVGMGQGARPVLCRELCRRMLPALSPGKQTAAAPWLEMPGGAAAVGCCFGLLGFCRNRFLLVAGSLVRCGGAGRLRGRNGSGLGSRGGSGDEGAARVVQILKLRGVAADEQAQDPAGDNADLALHRGDGHAVVAAVRQPGQRALQADAAEEVDVGDALPLAEAGDSTEV